MPSPPMQESMNCLSGEEGPGAHEVELVPPLENQSEEVSRPRPSSVLLKSGKVAPVVVSPPHSILPTTSRFFTDIDVADWNSALLSDSISLSAVVGHMMSTPQSFTAAELAAFSQASSLTQTVARFAAQMSPYSQSLRAISSCRAYHEARGEGSLYGQISAVVSGACADVAAFNFHSENRHALLRRRAEKKVSSTKRGAGVARDDEDDTEDLDRAVAKPNEHCKITIRRAPAPPGLPYSGREFVTLVAWKRLAENKIAIVYAPTEHDDVPRAKNNFVRALNMEYIEFTEISPGKTKVEVVYCTNLNGGKSLPAMMTTAVAMHKNEWVRDHVIFFQNIMPLSKLKEQDGLDLGDVLMDAIREAQKKANWKHKVEVVAKELDVFVERNAALRELDLLHPPFKPLLKAVLERRRAPHQGVVLSALANLSVGEAAKIGSFLTGEISIAATSVEAIDKWIGSQLSLAQLDGKYDWFRPFMYAVAMKQVGSGDWAVMARVIVGAALSMFDMGSDIFMIYRFFTSGQEKYARANLAMVLTNLSIQILIVLYATSKMKTSTKIKEVLFVVLCIKPGVDAYRVATDYENDEQTKMEPLHELVLSRGAETVTEAIPAAVSQSYALFMSKKKDSAAFASVILSIATTSFTVATMSFDYDISPKKREANPEFYGYVKAESRTLTFFLLFTIAFFHVTITVFSCFLVAAANVTVLFIFLSIDLSAFVVYKILRGDFIYAICHSVSLPTALGSLVQRGATFLLVAFTGSFTQRHSYELTPAYWALRISFMPVSAVAAAYFYNSAQAGGGREPQGERLRSETVWTTIGGLIAVWLAAWVLFLTKIDRKFLHTFYSTQTARQFVIAWFRAANSDEKKALIFKKGFHVWRSIEEEVRTWVHTRFETWEREKPEWWNSKLIRKIPEQVLSKEQRERLFGGKKRRKSSILQEVGLVE